MDKNLLKTVTAAAKDVRNWAEGVATNDDLCGWCAIASAALHRELKAVGIKAEVHMHEGKHMAHCFCVVDDHVVDVTATQFSEFQHKKVVILHVKEAETFEYYVGTKVFKTTDALGRYQKKSGWPSHQIAQD